MNMEHWWSDPNRKKKQEHLEESLFKYHCVNRNSMQTGLESNSYIRVEGQRLLNWAMALLHVSLVNFNIYFKTKEYDVYKRPRVLAEVKKKCL